ncbi:hypothetical protein BST97_09690 [Nonlabens spongiae]|uniref:Shedu protein SduA C-terminal domain-containing protein n=1 Tax=Nonlabens spongiae TaxID=331648 RepID=A0A1W6MKV2_9FLAO|nr:Shedu anti-phage system protein SduA domain-containing protein [Nonlabens spongiae]ARN78241.1 hypothetical protein BST97_09690 [Nonlabens spongiae]
MALQSNDLYGEFDMTTRELEELDISENSSNTHCYIVDNNGKMYVSFIMSKKKRVKTICKTFIRKSRSQQKYVLSLEFRKENLKGESTVSKGDSIIIPIKENQELSMFWKLISFFQKFNHLVDTGDFSDKYQAITGEGVKEFYSRYEASNKLTQLLDLISSSDLSEDQLKSVIFNQRKKHLYTFYLLLKDSDKKGESIHPRYREKNEIKQQGSEAIWHHFLKRNKWILGLNTELRFIFDLHSEHKLGEENSRGAGSSKTDYLGTSYFTTIIELKTEKTKIFKNSKGNSSRANTWSFSSDFIEAYSQILAQNDDIQKNRKKRIEFSDGTALNRDIIKTLDPKCVLIIGTRNNEFPHIDTRETNFKTETFERIRRDIKKIDIITYDELFERAYHIVNPTPLPSNWFTIPIEEFIEKYLE